MLRENNSLYFDKESKPIHRLKKEKSKTEIGIRRELGKVNKNIIRTEYLLRLDQPETKKMQLKNMLNELYDEQELWQMQLVKESNINRPQRKFRRKYKKRKPEVAYQLIKNRIKKIIKDPSCYRKIITKEETARILNIPEKQVEQTFHQLNLEGVLSQAIHEYPHDNNRNPWDGGGFSGWQSDVYEILGNSRNSMESERKSL